MKPSQVSTDSKNHALDIAKKEEEEPVKVKKWTEKELHEPITIKIAETETTTLLHIPSIRVWGEDEALTKTTVAKNQEYTEMIAKHKTESEKFVGRHAQTFNNSLRDKEVQAAPPETTESGMQITTWDIYDAYQDNDVEKPESVLLQSVDVVGSSAAAAPASSATGDSSQHINKGGASTSAIINQSSMIHKDRPTSLGAMPVLNTLSPYEQILELPAFARALDVVEQAVIQNEIHAKQLLYRNHSPTNLIGFDGLPIHVGGATPSGQENMDSTVDDKGKEASAPHLIHLWSFACPMVEDINVSCLCFNKQNQDLLAAGYGSLEFGNTNTGMILFWSLKNPKYPQKIIHTKHSVTSLDFCQEHPHLLAAGMYDGSVAIYDIRDNTDKPALESAHATGKHSEPVWGVKWVAKESTKQSQQLMSVSTDGSVQQWSMKKGLVPHELMQLKRIPNRAQFQGSHMEGISREASGLCFDFPIDDGTQYFAGTEDGLIHKCSVSYNEQTLENYYGHTGPVYKVRASPFLADAFLSCSADWTVALWDQKTTKPVLTFQSGHDYVMDINWAPNNACVFGSVSRDGRVEVWDLESSPLDPVIKHQVEGMDLTAVLFAPNAPVVLTGANNGVIDVYRMVGAVAESNSDWTAQKQVQHRTHCDIRTALDQKVDTVAHENRIFCRVLV